MKFTNRLAATTTSYGTYPLEDALAGIAAAGFRYVELAAIPGVIEHVPLKAGAKTRGHIQRLLNQWALIPVALSAHSNLTSRKGVKDALRALDLCEKMGIGIMNTAVGGPHEGSEDEAAFMSHIGKIADYAAARQIVITLEIHGELTATGQKTKRLVDQVDRPNVRINYDTANCEYFGDVPAVDDLPHAVDAVALCHLKDKIGGTRVWNFPTLGKGHVDFHKLLRDFKASNYAGPFSVEVEFQGEPLPAIPVINKAMKNSYKFLEQFGLS